MSASRGWVNRYAGSIAAVAIVFMLAACGDRAAKLPKLSNEDVIVAFGDSLTYGTGAAEHESYPAVLARLTGRKVVRSGVPGEVTAQALKRLPDVIEEYRPRLVIVCIGGNDMLRRLSISEAHANVRALIKTLKDRDIAVVLIGVPQPALLSSPPEFYAALAREFSIPYESEILKTVLYTAEMKADPIHPNARGYRRMAEAVVALLRKAGAI
ncbi:MAG: arylesterase [Burkholderiales bacterium]|nr:arylesterase [Burkholderiales bacterium]